MNLHHTTSGFVPEQQYTSKLRCATVRFVHVVLFRVISSSGVSDYPQHELGMTGVPFDR